MNMPNVGMLFYFSKFEKKDIVGYEPMSMEVFNDLKSFEPGKFTLEYDDYIRLIDKPNYDRIKLNNEYCNMELQTFLYDITNEISRQKTKERIINLEKSDKFISWGKSEEIVSEFKK